MVLVLFSLPDSVSYLYQILSKYLIGFKSYDLNTRVDARVVANVNVRTNGRKTGSLYRAMPEAGATKRTLA